MRTNKSTKNERHRAKKILLKCEFVANMTQQYLYTSKMKYFLRNTIWVLWHGVTFFILFLFC